MFSCSRFTLVVRYSRSADMIGEIDDAFRYLTLKLKLVNQRDVWILSEWEFFMSDPSLGTIFRLKRCVSNAFSQRLPVALPLGIFHCHLDGDSGSLGHLESDVRYCSDHSVNSDVHEHLQIVNKLYLHPCVVYSLPIALTCSFAVLASWFGAWWWIKRSGFIQAEKARDR